MSRRTREINRVTGGIISISLKLILLALVCILMYEGVTRGYSFGHEIFAPAPMGPGGGSIEAGYSGEGNVGHGDRETVKGPGPDSQ